MELHWNINLDRRTAESAGGALVFHPQPDGNFWIAVTSAKSDLTVLLGSASAAIADALRTRRATLLRLAAPARG